MMKNPVQHEIIEPINLKAYTFLIVEDDIFCFEMMKHILSDTSANLLYAQTGTQAIDIINNSHIDLVFLDIHLPDMTGFETIVHIRRYNRELPVIAQTAFAFQKDQEMIYTAGFNDLVIKPFSRQHIINILNTFLKLPHVHVKEECI
jgi:CheY-like chemotaxis protein